MPLSVSRRLALRGLAAIALCPLGSALGENIPPAPRPGGVQVPRFGHDKTARCPRRARERVRAVMDGTASADFEDHPSAGNRACGS
jgi:hypothetical protein